MTHERDIERLLDTWFSDGPAETPDRVIDTVADRIARQPQRPAWRLTWRHHPLNAYLKPLALVAATIIVALLGFNLFSAGSPEGGVGAPAVTPSPTPSPTPSLSPSPTPSLSPVAFQCDDGTTTGCAGPLAAGPVSTVTFKPAFSLTLPDGWTNQLDIARTYALRPSPHSLDLAVMSKLAIPEQNAECTAEARPGAGNTVTDWVEFITTHPGLTAGDPSPVKVGGYEGQRVQFRVADDWTARCPESIGPAVVLFTDSGAPPQRSTWIDDQVLTAWILDVAGETVIIHVTSAPSLTANDRDVVTVQPILDSMTFTPAN